MGKSKKQGGMPPSLYYDVKVKRFRDRKGRFVSMAKALEYLLTHKTVPVRGKTGKFYRSSVKQAQSYMQHIVKNVWIPRRDIRTDTFAIDVTPYFVFDSEGIRCKNSERIYTIIEAIQKAYERRYNRRRYYLYFEGEIIDVNTGNREGTLQISSKQLTERHETWNYVLAMIEEFEEKVNREIYKFSRSRLMIRMDHVSLVFKGWNKKD